MRRHRVAMVLAGAAAVWCAAPLAATVAPAASAVAPAGTWGRAIEVPGLAQLNQGGNAEVKSVSCGAADNCTAGGSYSDGAFHAHAFLVRERAGIWRKAIEVPGLGILSAGGAAVVGSVSCTSAGNCAAIGLYNDASGRAQNFVVNETKGIWGNAIKVPGFGALNKHGSVGYGFVSCASAGNCAAAGTYTDGSLRWQAFVVSERNGIWGNAIKMPGSATLNVGGKAGITSVSCASAGNCAAGGYYTDGSGHTHAFVVSETNGTWRRAIEVPGMATLLNLAGGAGVNSVSCTSAGNCLAGGGYRDSTGRRQAFVVREVNGTWRKAFQVPGTGLLNWEGLASAESVSCATTGNCAAAGPYTDGGFQMQVYVASQTNGTWRKAIEVPGSATLPVDKFGSDALVSCATAGNCAVGLIYTESVTGRRHVFVANEVDGTWGNATEIPGLATLNAGGNASITSVSCRAAGNCAAAGTYTDGSGHTQAFVASQA
jgi:hypothetical protein